MKHFTIRQSKRCQWMLLIYYKYDSLFMTSSLLSSNDKLGLSILPHNPINTPFIPHISSKRKSDLCNLAPPKNTSWWRYHQSRASFRFILNLFMKKVFFSSFRFCPSKWCRPLKSSDFFFFYKQLRIIPAFINPPIVFPIIWFRPIELDIYPSSTWKHKSSLGTLLPWSNLWK